jgi:hypothetical protein
MTEEVLHVFAQWWNTQGRYLPPDISANEVAMRAFAAGWWEAVRQGVEDKPHA